MTYQKPMPLRGQSLHRREDERLLTGRGRFIEDLDTPGQVWMHVVRSPHAHADITGLDAEAARGMAGVLGVFTAATSPISVRCPAPCRWTAWHR